MLTCAAGAAPPAGGGRASSVLTAVRFPGINGIGAASWFVRRRRRRADNRYQARECRKTKQLLHDYSRPPLDERRSSSVSKLVSRPPPLRQLSPEPRQRRFENEVNGPGASSPRPGTVGQPPSRLDDPWRVRGRSQRG